MNGKTKKIIIGAAALGLMGAMTLGGTMAYLTTKTDPKVNNFTFDSDAIKAVLVEPNWDGIIGYNGTTAQYDTTKHADAEAAAADANLGMNVAKKMIPGEVAPKNPIVKNTCDYDEWVALKVTYVKTGTDTVLTDEEMDKVNAAMTQITYSGAWEYNSSASPSDSGTKGQSKVYFYKTKLQAGGQTEALFTEIAVSAEATNEQLKALEDMGGFDIKIEGFATQGSTAEDYAAFKTWGESHVKFE